MWPRSIIISVAVACLSMSVVASGANLTKGAKKRPPSQKASTISLQPILVTIDAKSLEGNKLGTATSREIAVILPPSYASSPERVYPVVYVLAGHDSTLYSMLPIKPVLREKLPPAGNELILVFLDAKNELGGAFYKNSPISGNWGDYVARDVVNYIDTHYRTIKASSSRGVVGHSMGGSGALQLILEYPDIFSAGYAISPGVFSENGMKNSQLVANGSIRERFYQIQEQIADLPLAQAQAKLIETAKTGAYDWRWSIGYGMAYVPEATAPMLMMPFPVQAGGQINEATWGMWAEGFGNWNAKIKTFDRRLRELRGLAIDCAEQDEYAWIPEGCHYLDQQLTEAEIPHVATFFDGGHETHVQERLMEHAIPWFSKILQQQ